MSEPVREDPAVVRQSLRWKRAGAFVLFLLVISFPLYKAVESGRRADAVSSEDRALLTSGEQLWGLNCSSCHGLNGEGVDAPALNSQEFLTSTTDEQMAGIIRGGIPGNRDAGVVERVRGPPHRSADRERRRVRALVGAHGADLSGLADTILRRRRGLAVGIVGRWRMNRRALVVAIVSAGLLAACSSGTPQGASNTVAMIPGYVPGGGTTTAVPQGYTVSTQPIAVTLGETDATHMFIDMAQSFAQAGPVTFIVTNTGKETHEFVVLADRDDGCGLPDRDLRGRVEPDRRGRGRCVEPRGDR